jgi:hypothetical protein
MNIGAIENTPFLADMNLDENVSTSQIGAIASLMRHYPGLPAKQQVERAEKSMEPTREWLNFKSTAPIESLFLKMSMNQELGIYTKDDQKTEEIMN